MPTHTVCPRATKTATTTILPSRGSLKRTVVLLALGTLLATSAGATSQDNLNTSLGKPFPDMQFDSLLTTADYASLGLDTKEGPFRLSAIPGRLLVLEFFSQYCLTCQRQAAYLDSFFRALRDGDLAGEVHLLTVGVGSRAKNLAQFRAEQNISYPVTADPFFERLLEMGDPAGTPFTVFLLRRDGQWILADYHLGFQGDAELMARSRVLVEGRANVVAETATIGERGYHPPLGLSDVQQEKRARGLLSRLAGEDVRVVAIEVPGRGRVYRAIGPGGAGADLYAHIASRDPVCDVCHAVHFLFAFDSAGRVRGFEPLHVTKYGNASWNREEAAQMEGLLRDRIMAELAFDPDVDAVTSATMSSALIFDEVRRAADLPALLGAR